MDTTTDGGAVDPSAPLAALGGRKQRKVYLNRLTGEWGWMCRVCPGHPRGTHHADAQAAAEAFRTGHAPSIHHQRHLRNLLARASAEAEA